MLSKYEKHCMQTVAFVKEQHERWLKFDKGTGGMFLDPSRRHPICPIFKTSSCPAKISTVHPNNPGMG
jgi:hypothetical protein